MKKVILIVTALVMVASGVAAVSAYEAHVINVKAKVENALYVADAELDFGTVFPQEWLNVHTDVEFSGSFSEADTRVNTVDFEVWAEDKFLDAGVDNVAGTADDNYYPWLGEALFIEMNGDRGYIGVATAVPLHAQPALAGGNPIVGTLSPTNTSQTVTMYLDVPVFDEFYNPETDVADKKRPDWADTLANVDPGDPCQILPLTTPQGYEMGVDIKIQVVDIYWVPQP